MRKVLCVIVGVWLAAAALLAGEPPGGRGGGREERRRPPRGDFPGRGMMGGGDPRGRFGAPGRREQELDVFDVAGRSFDLTEEQRQALGKLNEQYDAEEHQAMVETKKRLDRKFLELVVEVLADGDKGKYRQTVAAMAARDEAVEAATQALLDVLGKVREDQGVERRGPPRHVPPGKMDLVRSCLKLSDEQREQADQTWRDQFRGMRERIGQIRRPENWRDAEARVQYFRAIREAFQQLDEEAAKAIVPLLTDEQRNAYQTAAKALDDYNAKLKEADETLDKALVEVLGEEKARAVRARVPWDRGGAPERRFGPPPPPPGEGPPREGEPPPRPDPPEEF